MGHRAPRPARGAVHRQRVKLTRSAETHDRAPLTSGGMDQRTLGRTGVHVSPLCLGAMMFGAWGEPDHDASIRIIHRALDAGINFIDTADVYARGESEEIVGKALAGGRRDNVVLATKFHGTMGDDPNEAGNSRRWIFREVEASLQAPADRLDRPLPGAPLGSVDRPRGDARRADATSSRRARSATSAPRPTRRRRSSRRSGSRASAACSASSASSRRTRSSRAAIEADVLPTCLEHGMGVIPWSPLAGGWLSGRWRKGADDLTSRRAAMIPDRYDLSIPANQAKLEAADALGRLADETGISLIDMALAFVIRHPAVTAAIIGPRTMEQLESQLGAADVRARRRAARPHRRDRRARARTSTRPTPAGRTRRSRRRRGGGSRVAARRAVDETASIKRRGSERRGLRESAIWRFTSRDGWTPRYTRLLAMSMLFMPDLRLERLRSLQPRGLEPLALGHLAASSACSSRSRAWSVALAAIASCSSPRVRRAGPAPAPGAGSPCAPRASRAPPLDSRRGGASRRPAAGAR